MIVRPVHHEYHVRYNVPDQHENLDDVIAVAASDDSNLTRKHGDLEKVRRGESRFQQQQQQQQDPSNETTTISRLVIEFYTLSYLVFFSIIGTLARIGLVHLTTYPDAPTIFPTLWANAGGSFIMGFLVEDRKLFRNEWEGAAAYDKQIARVKAATETDATATPRTTRWSTDEGRGRLDPSVPHQNAPSSSASMSTSFPLLDLAAAKKAHLATKKTMPLYIGLTTGFCGSFTSFSAFIRDLFLALSNDLVSPDLNASTAPAVHIPRNGGYSLLALLAVLIETIGLSLAGYMAGTHLGDALGSYTPSLPRRVSRGGLFVDRVLALLGWGCWIAAVVLAVVPPRSDWRSMAVLAVVLAPLGCFTRFYVSQHLNGRLWPSFPLGTFVANVLGTVVLGVAWDVAHSAAAGGGGLLGCQLLQGVEDGFCGCLTTVSTWVSELSSLRRRSAYMYGATSVVVSFALMVVVMGGLRWTEGFAALQCRT